MDTRIILLLFTVQTLTAQLEDTPPPPAPTLPDLDLTGFPNSIRRLLANRPNINKVQSEPTDAAPPLGIPNTYGMNLRGDKMEIWNNIGERSLYIKDIAPSKLPTVTTDKHEINNATTQSSREKIPANVNHKDISDNNHKLTANSIAQKLPVKIPAIETVENDNNDFNKKFPSTTTWKPETHKESLHTLPSQIPGIVNHVNNTKYKHKMKPNTTPKNLTQITTILEEPKHKSDYDHRIPSITTLKPARIINQKNNGTGNEPNQNNTIGIERESLEHTNETGEIEKSFDNISAVIGYNNKSKQNLTSKTFGMKLTGDHGYIWNDLSKPGVHYNVGETNISENTNLTIEETSSESSATETPNESTIANLTTSSEPDNELNVPMTTDNITGSTSSDIKNDNNTESYVKPTTETDIVKPTANKSEDTKPPKNITPELDELLKKYIKKLVKEEVAKQLGINSTKAGTEINNGSGNNNSSHEEAKKESNLPAENDKDKTDCEQYKHILDAKDNRKKCQSYSGNILGNTNIFVLYPNDKTIQSAPHIDERIMEKPVKELLSNTNSSLSNDEIKKPGSKISNTVTEHIEIPDLTKNSEVSSDDKIEAIVKNKDKITATKEKGNVTHVENSVTDKDSKITENSTEIHEDIVVDETHDSSEGS